MQVTVETDTDLRESLEQYGVLNPVWVDEAAFVKLDLKYHTDCWNGKVVLMPDFDAADLRRALNGGAA